MRSSSARGWDGADGRRHRDQRQDDTATLAAAVLAGSGLESKLAGNADIAPPLSTVTGDPDAEPDLIVCEISSFQLECCPH